jgi:HK97 family phage portal protein
MDLSRMREWVTGRKSTGSGALVAAGPSRWYGWVSEAVSGAWQRNMVLDNTQTLVAFSAVYACISLIAGDIAKLRFKLMYEREDGTWEEFENSAHSPVLRKPNRYQTRLQFMQNWMTSKLMWGNTYVLKERDERGLVVAMYVMDPSRVLPLIAPDGEVYYQLGSDNLAGVQTAVPAMPASEIIHDRTSCLFHPLIGIPPLYACAASTTQGNRIQTNSAKFFENMSRPSGHLTAPGVIDKVTAERMKEQFESGFSGTNIGRLLVTGDGLKYEPFTMPADQAQLIEQLKWTSEDVARAFLVPLYKIQAGPNPGVSNISALNQEYYQQVLQIHAEGIELLLDDGLSLPRDTALELDMEGLLRMDPLSRAEKHKIQISAGMLSPNEARFSENMPPLAGGESAYLQVQNYSLSALAKRDARDDPFAPPTAPAPPPKQTEEETPPNKGTAAIGINADELFRITKSALEMELRVS